MAFVHWVFFVLGFFETIYDIFNYGLIFLRYFWLIVFYFSCHYIRIQYNCYYKNYWSLLIVLILFFWFKKDCDISNYFAFDGFFFYF